MHYYFEFESRIKYTTKIGYSNREFKTDSDLVNLILTHSTINDFFYLDSTT